MLSLLVCAPLTSSLAETNLVTRFPEAKAALPLIEQFPLLAKLLTLDSPWTIPPGELVAELCPEMKLVQGSDAYPLLFDAQRTAQWPGLQAWGQVAYETEYYVFDPARPIIRLHVGRPLESGIQLSDYSLSDETKALFPPIADSVRKEMLDKVEAVVQALKPYGATQLPFRHPRIRAYLLPGGTRLTLSDFSGTGRGTTYLQIDLEPA